jgi:hypothetical protein
MLFLMLRGIYLAQSRRDAKVRVLDTLLFRLLPDRTYTLTVNTKYDMWISGVKSWFFEILLDNRNLFRE